MCRFQRAESGKSMTDDEKIKWMATSTFGMPLHVDIRGKDGLLLALCRKIIELEKELWRRKPDYYDEN